jgi:hypothetical protein
MSEKVEPALTPEQWRQRGTDVAYLAHDGVWIYPGSPEVLVSGRDIPALVALANAALPHGHPGKLTRTHVNWLREEADVLKRNGAGAGALMATEIADALESYLPPEGV